MLEGQELKWKKHFRFSLGQFRTFEASSVAIQQESELLPSLLGTFVGVEPTFLKSTSKYLGLFEETLLQESRSQSGKIQWD